LEDFDWIDSLLEDEPISVYQISAIEGLLKTCVYPEQVKVDIENNMLSMSYQEANDVIYDLRENNIPKDPAEQFKRMFK